MKTKLIQKLEALSKLYAGSSVKPSAITIDFAEVEAALAEHAALVAVADNQKTVMQILADAAKDGRGLSFQQVSSLVAAIEPALAHLAAVRQEGGAK